LRAEKLGEILELVGLEQVTVSELEDRRVDLALKLARRDHDARVRVERENSAHDLGPRKRRLEAEVEDDPVETLFLVGADRLFARRAEDDVVVAEELADHRADERLVVDHEHALAPPRGAPGALRAVRREEALERFGLIADILPARQQDVERRAAPALALDRYRSAARLEEIVDDREPEPRPVLSSAAERAFRREERVEDPIDVLRSDARAGVRDVDRDSALGRGLRR